ncbi:hypothetical protein HK097_008406 [Rhizophlyctis rosea]|uniref:Uncharacterized protein n=1 Tax=Rhizophlyctis rosea TaxID=64517 RepID=A0AAD5X1Q4_9FUNG|nr:hypothetical protein HK097_008406 [Rhizophlyctis rosea]
MAPRKKKEFKVEPLPESVNKKYQHLGKYVPYPLPGWNNKPFILACLAPTGSGKTNALVRLVQQVYHKCFDEVVCFSPHMTSDEFFHELRGLKKIVYSTECDNEILDSIIKEQKKRQEAEKAGFGRCPNVLLVFDDFGPDFRGRDLKKSMQWLFSQGRHAGIHGIICSVQSLLQFEGMLISQANAWFLWALEERSCDKVCKELATNLMSRKQLKAFIDYGTSREVHSCCYVNRKGGLPEDSFFVHTSAGFENPQYVINLDLPELNVTANDGYVDVNQIEEQLRESPVWASLPSGLKSGMLASIQTNIAKSLIKEKIQAKVTEPEVVTPPAEEETGSRLQVKLKDHKPRQRRQKKKPAEEEVTEAHSQTEGA